MRAFMLVALSMVVSAGACAAASTQPARHTIVSIVGDEFYINGQPTYPGRSWQDHRIEGLLLNARLVQGIFDDLNPETVKRWAYPDTHKWDADRNSDEFICAMPSWREHGLLAFTLNLQGGSPEGYSRGQPWQNSAFNSDGSLREDYLRRLTRILDRADELGMVVILGYFYQAQDRVLDGDDAVKRGVDNATRWLLDRGYRNVIVEINNECDQHYRNGILQPERVHELIQCAQSIHDARGNRLLVSTSYAQGVPKQNVADVADFILVHGNGVKAPSRMTESVQKTRALCGEHIKSIVFNEDDHYEFEKPQNNMLAAVAEHASWGFFDYRRSGEPFDEGFQCVPLNWTISSERKTAFFDLVARITGSGPVATTRQ